MGRAVTEKTAVVDLDLVRDYAAKARRFRDAADRYEGEHAALLRSLSELMAERAAAASAVAAAASQPQMARRA